MGRARLPFARPSELADDDLPWHVANMSTRQQLGLAGIASRHRVDQCHVFAVNRSQVVPSADNQADSVHVPAQVYEKGLQQRTVLIEFESVAAAIAAHDSPGYQEALKALDNGAERDLRIIEGA